MDRNKWYNYVIGGVFILLLSILLTKIMAPFTAKLLLSGSKFTYFIAINISFIPFLLSIILIEIIYHKKKYSVNAKRIVFGFLIWIGILVLGLTYQILFFNDNLKNTYIYNDTIKFFFLSLIFTPIQTITEEIIFRGYLLRFLQSIKKGIVFPLIVSSLIFASLHMFNPEVYGDKILFLIAYLCMALLFGFLTLKYKGIEYSFGMHLANNLFAINIVNYPNSPIPSYPIFTDLSPITPLPLIVQSIIFGLIAMIIIKKIEDNNFLLKKK
ncbi:MAG: CPBP family intramembrane metalloprotease [Spirochaetales bacterium]|nr:CPBP family intramembrane metalloprotease [Spirochaetales bacterium]